MSSPSPSDNEHPAVGRSDAVASFPALRHRDFRLLWLGQLISVTGSQMQLLAINWHVYLLTKSPLALGGVGLVRVVPIVACSLVGGVVADAVDRKRLILVSQSVMLISAALLALMTATGIVTVWPIYVLTAIGSAAVAFDNPARQALLPKLVPAEDFPNAVSLGLVVFNSAMIVGPSIGGLLLRSHGPALIYALNAVSFLAVIVAVIMIRASGKPLVAQDSSAERGSSISFSAFQDGLRFVRHAPIIVQTMTLDFVATFFASATALLPIFADRILRVGPQGLGLLVAAPGTGSIITGLVLARLSSLRRQGKTVLAAVAVYGASTVVFALSRSFYLSLLMLGLSGAADTVSTVLRQTIRQLVTPDYLRGRMTSVNMIFFMGGPQLGEFEAGAVAALVGAQLSVLTGGVGCLIATGAAAIWATSLKAYDGHSTIRESSPGGEIGNPTVSEAAAIEAKPDSVVS